MELGPTLWTSPLFLAPTGDEDHVAGQRNNSGFSKLKRHRRFWGRPGDNIVFSLTILIMDVPRILLVKIFKGGVQHGVVHH